MPLSGTESMTVSVPVSPWMSVPVAFTVRVPPLAFQSHEFTVSRDESNSTQTGSKASSFTTISCVPYISTGRV